MELENQDKIRHDRKMDTEVHGQSFLYMFIFFSVALLVIFSMCFHFISLNNMAPDQTTNEIIKSINSAIPYDNLIYSLIIYALGAFGIEGTRSVIMSFDLKNISEKAKNMPKYKRDRLICMLFTFISITLLGMIFQMICISKNITTADFQLGPLTGGIAIFMALLAYADFGPKLSKQIGSFVSSIKKTGDEDPEEEGEVDTLTDEEKK